MDQNFSSAVVIEGRLTMDNGCCSAAPALELECSYNSCCKMEIRSSKKKARLDEKELSFDDAESCGSDMSVLCTIVTSSLLFFTF